MSRRHWLLKSEPESFSITDLEKAPKQTAFWDGVRNYQARNFLRDELKVGDGVLFYHSNAAPPAVAGTATVVGEGEVDPSQFDADSDYYDAASKPDAPRWYGVRIKLDKVFSRPVTLDTIRATPSLSTMVLVQRSRLSVQPVTALEWKTILKLAETKAS
ncbi:MAG TPA: EVE domain-containing protein [Polyangia bacterium]